MKQSFFSTIIKSGLIVGTLDITFACISAYMRASMLPYNLIKFVASGVYGKAAFEGGSDMVAMGLLFHYCIAFAFTILFFYAYPYIVLLHKNWVVTGVLYGAFVWSVMNLIVLPMTHVAQSPFNFTRAAIGMSILIIAIGLPLSYLANRFYK
jgi:hypothetical protein